MAHDKQGPGKSTASRIAVRAGVVTPGNRALPEEVPVALSFSGTTQAVMMATPADLKDFGIGFAISEAIIGAASDIAEMEIVELDQGFDVQMQLRDSSREAFMARRRKMAGPVGCGLCGIDSIEEALRALPVRDQIDVSFCPGDIHDAVHSLSVHQKLRAETGAVHAAGFFRLGMAPGAGIECVREDVGRHNALDKLIGALACNGQALGKGAVVITSRISVDMVQKAVVAGAGLLIAVSAPTALAVRTAQAAGLTLVGIARGADFEIFSRPDRMAASQTRQEQTRQGQTRQEQTRLGQTRQELTRQGRTSDVA